MKAPELLAVILYLIEYQADTLLYNRQKWFDNCPIVRTRDGLDGPSRVLYGGIGFPRTPCGLKPFPYLPPASANTRAGRAPDGAIASLQVLRFSVCAVLGPCFRVFLGVGTVRFATSCVSSNYKTAGSRSPVFPRGLEPPLFYDTDNQTNTERLVPTLWLTYFRRRYPRIT